MKSFGALSLVLLAGLSLGAETPQVPTLFLDPAEGEIGGRTAVALLPVDGLEPDDADLLPPAAFEAHLSPPGEPSLELSFPCGVWFQPPKGRYRVWAQGNWKMSPHTTMLVYAGQPFKGRGLASTIPVVDAGRVTLPASESAGGDLELRLLHAGPYLHAGFARRELVRSRPSAEAGDGVLMPEGPTVAGLWSRRSDRYVALSRPFLVAARERTAAPLDRPGQQAHLVVQLRRHARARKADDYDVELSLRTADGERPPDLRVPTAEVVYGFWYDLEPGSVELTASSKDARLSPLELQLGRGRVERVVAELTKLPDLQVEVDLPAQLDGERVELLVHRLPAHSAVASATLPPGIFRHRFQSLPAALLEVEMKVESGAHAVLADLSSGEDASVLLAPEVVLLWGRVLRGGEGAPASLRFETTRRHAVEVATEADGTYQAAVLEPVRSVSVQLRGDSSPEADTETVPPPYADFFSPPITASRELDFELPAERLVATVVDAETGEGIGRAAIFVRNSFVEEHDSVADGEMEKAVSHRVTTDESGHAELPPLRRGRVELSASADGYVGMRDPLVLELADNGPEEGPELRLHPLGELVDLHLQLPGGEPAAGAEVQVVEELGGGAVLFAGRAGPDGKVSIPGSPRDVAVLVRHPEAGAMVREAPGSAGPDDEVTWSLDVAADRRLILRVMDPSGRQPLPRAEVALWLNGRRVWGRALGWLTRSHPSADADGYWIGDNLPAAGVLVVAWDVRLRDQATRGDLDSLAQRVPHPWPNEAVVRAVQ